MIGPFCESPSPPRQKGALTREDGPQKQSNRVSLLLKTVLRHKLHISYYFKPDYRCLADLGLQACEQEVM